MTENHKRFPQIHIKDENSAVVYGISRNNSDENTLQQGPNASNVLVSRNISPEFVITG
jgi:hypothetical protein